MNHGQSATRKELTAKVQTAKVQTAKEQTAKEQTARTLCKQKEARAPRSARARVIVTG
jgi:hypothetical protein